jgi:hypothetical protein
MLSREQHNPLVNIEKKKGTHTLIFRSINFNRYRAASNNNFAFPRSRIHERSIAVRFLGIILRVLRFKVSVWISKTIGKRV